jgi:DNA polymerase elongation subunit (family B)
MEIYKRFSPGEKESFKLNSIAQLELGESKLDMGVSNFVDFMNNDWQKFVSYNIQDVRLLKGLDAKLGFLSLIRMFAYIGLTTFESALGSISVINGASAICARRRNQLMPTFVRNADSKINPGAYVRDPLQGFQKHIVSFDANSLYPNVMISLNMSTETKMGKIVSRENGIVNIRHVNGKHFSLPENKLSILIEKEQLALSKADVFFTQGKKGVFPEVLDYYYKKRVATRAELKKVKVKLKEMEEEMEEIKKQLEADTQSSHDVLTE